MVTQKPNIHNTINHTMKDETIPLMSHAIGDVKKTGYLYAVCSAERNRVDL